MGALDIATIDDPIVELVKGLAQLPYCFTLQSCYGHFLFHGQQDVANTDPLPSLFATARIEYRIAYLALCLQDCPSGRTLYDDLSEFPSIDDAYIQFGCAEWFWERQVNSYVLQVEPERFKNQDRAVLDYHEALHIEGIRNDFFAALASVVGRRVQDA